jgi:hypothetical protein
MPLHEHYVVHYIMLSFSSLFDNFKINNNWSDKKWALPELIAKCSKEKERLRLGIRNLSISSIKTSGRTMAMINMLENFLTTRKGRERIPIKPQRRMSLRWCLKFF